jgi:large subunit ribosomal protein L18
MSTGRQDSKVKRATRRRRRIRKRIRGRAERPRLVVSRSLRHLYAQVVDDDAGRTLVALSSRASGLDLAGDKKAQSKKLGEALAARAKEKGIENVVFDRDRSPYHGRIRMFAEGARAGGLKF